jgi:hypothetical protein
MQGLTAVQLRAAKADNPVEAEGAMSDDRRGEPVGHSTGAAAAAPWSSARSGIEGGQL